MGRIKLGVLGGTFDPLHYGHLALARAAVEHYRLSRLVIVPAGEPWQKSGWRISAASERLEMVKLAVASQQGFEVSPLEVDRCGPSYTVNTLAALAGLYPGAEFLLVLGADVLANFLHWYRPRRILELAQIVAARRPSLEGMEALDEVVTQLGSRLSWLPMPPIDISSTDIRRRVVAGRTIRGLVPPAVEEFIRRRSLYKM